MTSTNGIYRQIIGYVPSNVIPAVVSVVMIYAYTRLLSPGVFGNYSYILTIVLVLQTSLFYALPVAVMRFYPAADKEDRQADMLKVTYLIFYAVAIATIVVGSVIMLTIEVPVQDQIAYWLALPMLLFRSLMQLNQSVNRSANRMARYNSIECVHALLGFGLGLIALYILGPNAGAIIIGLLLAAVLCALPDAALLNAPFYQRTSFDKAELSRLIQYATPLVAVAATAMILQNGDRFLVGSLAGLDVLGIYAVAFNLVERPTSLICVSISTATFPLVVQILEHQGKEAARVQAGYNGIALLAITLPTCVGLALTADYVSASLVGPEFRSGVAALIPIMSFTALARGLRSHFIDHAFHLSGRPLLMLWTYGPATVLNIALNMFFIPRYGIFGAAWTGFACQCATVLVGWFLGTALFPIWLPVWQVVRCVAAVIPMAGALVYFRFPLDWFGLMAAVLMGGTLYIISALVLDVGEVRSLGLMTLRERSARGSSDARRDESG